MQPERQAQTLLHTFLKARFLTRLDAVEEVSAGAGRLDLLLKFSGGLGAVVDSRCVAWATAAPMHPAGRIRWSTI